MDDIVNTLREQNEFSGNEWFGAAADEIERIRAERDHARRLHCYAVAGTMHSRSAEDVAKCLGWDCFKEDR